MPGATARLPPLPSRVGQRVCVVWHCAPSGGPPARRPPGLRLCPHAPPPWRASAQWLRPLRLKDTLIWLLRRRFGRDGLHGRPPLSPLGGSRRPEERPPQGHAHARKDVQATPSFLVPARPPLSSNLLAVFCRACASALEWVLARTTQFLHALANTPQSRRSSSTARLLVCVVGCAHSCSPRFWRSRSRERLSQQLRLSCRNHWIQSSPARCGGPLRSRLLFSENLVVGGGQR